MTGIVVRVFHNKGFGFVRGEDGVSRFAHASDFDPPESFDFTHEGRGVSFTPDRGQRGPKAIEIRLLAAVDGAEVARA